MKVVIVDIYDKYAIALNKDGKFIKIAYKANFQIGYEVDISPYSSLNFSAFNKIVSIAAVFVFLLAISGYVYFTPYSYVYLDINPSVEITSNIFNKILEIKSLNDDGLKIIAETNLKNNDINTGVNSLIRNAVKKGYLKKETDNAILITVSSKQEEKSSGIKNQLFDSAKQELKSDNIEAEIVNETVTSDRRNEALKSGISPGKMLLIDKLKKVEPEITLNDYKNKPIREILKPLKNSAANKSNNINNPNKKNDLTAGDNKSNNDSIEIGGSTVNNKQHKYEKNSTSMPKRDDTDLQNQSIDPAIPVNGDIVSKNKKNNFDPRNKEGTKSQKTPDDGLMHTQDSSNPQDRSVNSNLQNKINGESERNNKQTTPNADMRNNANSKSNIEPQNKIKQQNYATPKSNIEKQKGLEPQKNIEKQKGLEPQKNIEKQKGLEPQKNLNPQNGSNNPNPIDTNNDRGGSR